MAASRRQSKMLCIVVKYLAADADIRCLCLCSSGGLENHALKACFRHHKDVRHTFVMSCSRTFLGSVEKHSCLFYGLPHEILSMVEQICGKDSDRMVHLPHVLACTSVVRHVGHARLFVSRIQISCRMHYQSLASRKAFPLLWRKV